MRSIWYKANEEAVWLHWKEFVVLKCFPSPDMLETLCSISLGEALHVNVISLAKQDSAALLGYFCCCLYRPEISLLFDIHFSFII